MTETSINRKYKDRLFTLLFGRSENRAWTLELYNAVNGSSYDNPEDLEITTIEDALYMGVKNDVSFILNEYMSIYEQQSSYNPNMPLRQLIYAGKLYDKYIRRHKLNVYGTRTVRLPIPKLVVFYNGGDRDCGDETVLNLNDSFDKEHADESDISVRVRMLNINYDRNRNFLDACKPLAEYSWLIKTIRYNRKELKLEEGDAIDMAIDAMPKDYKIRPFIMGHRAEVKMGWLEDYDEEEIKELFKEDGRREALCDLIRKKLAKGKTIEIIADEMEMESKEIRALCDEIRREAVN